MVYLQPYRKTSHIYESTIAPFIISDGLEPVY